MLRATGGTNLQPAEQSEAGFHQPNFAACDARRAQPLVAGDWGGSPQRGTGRLIMDK